MIVWLFILSYWGVVSFISRGSSSSQLPSTLTPSLFLGLVVSALVEYGPILLFLFLFVRFYEKRRGLGLRSLLASVGLTVTGARKSLKWSLIFLVAAVPVGLLALVLESAVAGTGAEHLAGSTSSSSSIPSWYLPFIVGTLLVDVVTEETTVRGYILDRLMPAHPSTLRQSLSAVLITSVMMSSYHLAPYLFTYGFSPPLTAVNLLADFLFSILVSFAYVKSKARTVSGPILFHFILDAFTLL